MKFKPGDLVIKSTGGNKMKIISCQDTSVDCAWFTETYHESTFDECELVPINQYQTILLTEKREDLIDQILNETYE
jgi:uncharacterized protein YodC (DUF2158 family)